MGNKNLHIIFDIFIKKYNKKFKLIWNGDYFDDNKIITLFDLDKKTVKSQIEILGAQLIADIDKEYVDYFNNNYSIEDYKSLFDTYYYKDPRSKHDNVLEDIVISYNCQVGYDKIANSFFSEFVTWYWYDNDIDFLEDELDHSYNEKKQNIIRRILNLDNEEKIREELEREDVVILENKKRGGFYYFYDNQTLFCY